MSKSVGKLLGAGTAGTKSFASERQYLDFLNNYNTANVDNAYQNMAETASNLSSTLSSRPDYIYSVDGSDNARIRAEQATYNQAVSQMEPEFEDRRKQLETRLQNQGFSVDSEAYQTALKNLEDSQNKAYSEAAYNSVLAGQNAFSNSLNNQIMSANFQNLARQQPISEIGKLLQNQYSGYDVANQIFNVQKGRDTRINQAQNQNAAPFYSYNPNSVPTEQEPVQSGSYPSYANTDDTAAASDSAPSEEVNSEVDEYYHPTVQSPEANGEIPSVEVQDSENEQQSSDENTDINE